ncbi:hypothetical protein ABID97_003277 [Variovorax sp. OAS795]|uniref:hypothetical protein n=1 Tax=Variovorax sp. OAS795 TaxID=3034231 RepID=UPI00339766D6
MTSVDADPDAFLALLDCGLISSAQHEAVIAHPENAALPPLPGPAHALAWMCVKGLITRSDLKATVEDLEKAAPDRDRFSIAEDIAWEAEEMLELGDRGITHEAVTALYNVGLIDIETRDMALEETPLVGTAPAAPADTLAWLVIDGLLEQEQFKRMLAEVEAEAVFATAAERARIVAEARVVIAADEHTRSLAHAKARRKRRNGAWTIGLAALALVAWIGWGMFTPADAPACDADSTRATLRGLMLRVSIQVRRETLDVREKSQIGLYTVSGIRQVGYRKDERMRGCMATMTRGAATTSIAFTIGPDSPDEADKMMVRGAKEAIVQARFGNLDANGRPLYTAEPLGRAALEKALREGVENLPRSLSRQAAESLIERMAERARQGRHTGLAATDPDRKRKIADFELTGACRAHEDGTSHICPLVIEYNDRLLSLTGGTSLVLRSEFTFVPENGSWRMGNDFATRFDRALMDSRRGEVALPQ